jgi:alkylhydroperoxidase family enzyme
LITIGVLSLEPSPGAIVHTIGRLQQCETQRSGSSTQLPAKKDDKLNRRTYQAESRTPKRPAPGRGRAARHSTQRRKPLEEDKVTRIPYLAADLTEPREVVDAIRQRRGGELLNIDRLLLYSPPVAAGWTAHASAIQTRLDLPARLRELAIVSVSALMGTWYEVGVHGPRFLAAGGTQDQLDSVRANVEASANDTDLFDEVERAVLRLSFEMTRAIAVDDDAFASARAALGNDRLMIEAVAVIATYNMTNRFLRALKFGDTR